MKSKGYARAHLARSVQDLVDLLPATSILVGTEETLVSSCSIGSLIKPTWSLWSVVCVCQSLTLQLTMRELSMTATLVQQAFGHSAWLQAIKLAVSTNSGMLLRTDFVTTRALTPNLVPNPKPKPQYIFGSPGSLWSADPSRAMCYTRPCSGESS